MSVASQLYQLQGFDTEIESSEKALDLAVRQLADRSLLTEAQDRMTTARRKHATLTKQQRDLEFEIDDIAAKIKLVETRLYGGQVRNPKELTDLQREVEMLKAQRGRLEDRELETMEQVEASSGEVAILEDRVKKAEAAWQSRDQKLRSDVEALKTTLADLKQRREALVGGIDPQAIAVYQEAKKKRGTAVARVEQGLCQGCRISLPVSEFQKAKSGALVRCGSCGRILYVGSG
jgi:uncharacterized protein